tara:strand:+ start:13674 stop:14690 length:1017 start_codon:yes stop_codon:yes gene_type:complete
MKKLVLLHSLHGSGNHLVNDYINSHDILRLPDWVERFIVCEILISNNYNYVTLDPLEPKNINEFVKLQIEKLNKNINSDEKFRNLKSINFDNYSSNSPKKILKEFLINNNKKDLVLLHTDGYFFFEQYIITGKEGNENKILWDKKYINQARIILNELLNESNFQLNEFILIRNPIDILISNVERHKLNRENLKFLKIKKDINFFFDKVNNTNLDIIKYENIEKINYVLKKFNIPKKKNYSQKILIHCTKNKYLKNIENRFEKEICEFEDTMKRYDYNIIKNNLINFTIYHIKKFLGELKLIFYINFFNYKYLGKIYHSRIGFFPHLLNKILKFITLKF